MKKQAFEYALRLFISTLFMYKRNYQKTRFNLNSIFIIHGFPTLFMYKFKKTCRLFSRKSFFFAIFIPYRLS